MAIRPTGTPLTIRTDARSPQASNPPYDSREIYTDPDVMKLLISPYWEAVTWITRYHHLRGSERNTSTQFVGFRIPNDIEIIDARINRVMTGSDSGLIEDIEQRTSNSLSGILFSLIEQNNLSYSGHHRQSRLPHFLFGHDVFVVADWLEGRKAQTSREFLRAGTRGRAYRTGGPTSGAPDTGLLRRTLDEYLLRNPDAANDAMRQAMQGLVLPDRIVADMARRTSTNVNTPAVNPGPTTRRSPKNTGNNPRRVLDLDDVDRTQFCAAGDHRWVDDKTNVGCDKDCVCKVAMQVCADCGHTNEDDEAHEQDRQKVISRCRDTNKLIGG